MRVFPDKKSYYFVIILLSFFAYFNSLSGEFIYDDHHFVVDNPFIKDLSNFWYYFTKKETLSFSGHGIYRPLRTLSFALDYWLFRLKSFGFHLTNVILHTLNGIIIFLLIKRITQNKFLSLIVSLIFLIHPLQTESVSWISSRSESLFSLFFLLAFLFYLKDNLSLCILFYFLSLLSKESAIVLPLILFSFDFIFRKREIKSRLKVYLYLILIASGYIFTRFSILGRFSQKGWWGDSPYYNFLTVIKVFGSYLRLLVFPVNLRLIYVIPIAKSILQPEVLFSLSLFIVFVFLFLFFLKSQKILSFSLAWSFIHFLPYAQILPISGGLLSEHFFYLGLMGFALILGLGIHRLKAKARTLGYLLLIIILAQYFYLTLQRNRTWKDNASLWQDTLRKAPTNFKAHIEVGNIHFNQGRFAAAIREYEKAIELNPKDSDAYANLGRTLAKEGRFQEAEENCLKAIQLEPTSSKAYLALGIVKFDANKLTQAIRSYLIARQLNPLDAYIYYNLAMAYDFSGQLDLAIETYQTSLRLNPDYFEAYNNLGIAYAKLGMLQKAKDCWQKALKINPQGKPAQDNLKRIQDAMEN